MKFAIAVVLLALAVGSNASWGGHYAPALSYTAVSGPHHGAWGAWGAAPYAAHHATWAAAPAAVDISHGAWGHGAWGHGAWGHGAPAAVAVHHGAWAAPAAVAVHHGAWAAPAAIAHHAAIAPVHGAWHGHEGSYVAQTRGATHIAPLAGHAHSAASINVHPAPGTI